MEGYPGLTTRPGDYIAIKYLENGYIILPAITPRKPIARGTIFVFRTSQPSVDKKL
jgi:hypothetical protein